MGIVCWNRLAGRADRSRTELERDQGGKTIMAYYTASQLGYLQAFGLSTNGLLGLQSNPWAGLGGLSGIFDRLLPDTFGGQVFSFTAPDWLAKLGASNSVSSFSLFDGTVARALLPAPTPAMSASTQQPPTPSTGIFGYKDYSTAKSAQLVDTAFKLATFAQMDKIYGINVAGAINTIGNALPDGLMANKMHIELPPGWSKVDPAALGLSSNSVDSDGYYIIRSPLTGTTYSGPQAQVLEQRDGNGHVIGLSVAFVGTNSPVDVLDYLQLNSGEIAPNMEPLLNAVRDYAVVHHLGAEDVTVTGYSLGAAYTNVMARFADGLSGGFFANSNYVAYEVPYIFDQKGRVLNIGYENDVVHRAAGDWASFADAVAAAPGLIGQDYKLHSSTDNLILFSDDYASAVWPLGPFALYNIVGGWSAHVAGITTDGLQRIMSSHFYDFTTRDSLVIVSNLSALSRETTWVQDLDRPSDRYGHVGDSAFLVGTSYDDKIAGNRGNDYIDGMGGNDIIRGGTGANRIEGGAGRDTLQLQGTMNDWTVTKLADGTLAFFSKSYGMNIVSGTEQVTFLDTGPLHIPRNYDIMSDKLEDLTYSGAFDWLDQDVAFVKSTQGTAGNDTLSGKLVFGLAGNDIINGTSGADVLYGGMGSDKLNGGAGNDFVYGGEGNDMLTGGGGNDLLNGGLGSDQFAFDAKIAGLVTIEDFRLGDDELDMIVVRNSGYASAAELLNHATQTADGVLFDFGNADLLVAHAHMSDLSKDMLLLA